MTESEKIAEHNLRWLGVDLDRTLAQNSPYPEYALLEPVEGAREAMIQLTQDRWKIIVYTSRPWHDHQIIEKWLRKYDIPHKQIICGKPFFKYMIDDRAIAFRGDWDAVVKEVV